MYLRAAKTEAEDAGESTEGMAGSVSELRDEILKLTGNKVDIQIDENSFKSTFDILKELSSVWGELEDVSKANILEMIGGKRNANVVSALLENFTIADRALESSLNSFGSAVAENEKYLDSIQGRISQFQAAFQNLSTTLGNTDIIKGVVSAGTGLVNLISTICDKIGLLGVALGAVPLAIFVSKLKPVADGLNVVKEAFKSTVGGAKGRPLKYAHYTVMVTWSETEHPARRCIANGLKSQDFYKWCA